MGRITNPAAKIAAIAHGNHRYHGAYRGDRDRSHAWIQQTFGPAALAWLPLRCLRSTSKRQRVGSVLCGAAIAVGINFGIAGWLAKTEPSNATIVSLAVVTTPGTVSNRDIEVTISTPIPRACRRTNQHLLYRVGDDGVPRYFPLGSALNGAGFKSPGLNPPVGKFVLSLALPPSIPSGEYWYVSRSVYACSWFWGWFSRDIADETPPVKVVI